MRKIVVGTFLLSVLWSCDSPTQKESSTKPEKAIAQDTSDFKKYISTLNQIPLPLEINPLAQFPDVSNAFDKNAFEKYKYKWAIKPLGIFYQDEETIGIIDCSNGDWGLVPFLTTYDRKGNKIDSTGFYDKSGQDMGYEAIEHLTFNPDKTIYVLDTVKRWDINEEEMDVVEGSMKMTTGKVVYQVLADGKIKKPAER
ncbi:hypothetical protein [Nibribacter koreensis]|uniref:WG containing repeat-containing protein n=1 Tax=Nibribacter koreensis TaxID=1084519 RepID=A0ABP8FZX8_9BACT